MYDIDEEFLHNAGNDVVCTLIAAILMAYKAPTSGHSVYYKELKRYLQVNSKSRSIMAPKFGTYIFCEKCSSHSHLASHCTRRDLYCHACMKHPNRSKTFTYTHRTTRCVEHVKDKSKNAYRMSQQQPNAVVLFKYPIPCRLCIESTDPDRYTHEHAYNHVETDCMHRAVDKPENSTNL
jgi:hypothetical protein